MMFEATIGDFQSPCLSPYTYQVQALPSYFIVGKLEVFIRCYESVVLHYDREEY